MSPLIKQLLLRCEHEPPTFAATEIRGALKMFLTLLQQRGLVQPTHSLDCWRCSECHDHTEIVFTTNRDGVSFAYARCDCGLNQLTTDQYQRLAINPDLLLASIFRQHRIELSEVVPKLLWNVGRATWNQRAHSIWFARRCDRRSILQARPRLESRPKTILFVPTLLAADCWADQVANPVIALEPYLDWCDNDFCLDNEAIAARVDQWLSSCEPATKPKPKRASRAANIEALRKELIQHLKSAADHAHDTLDRTGEPQLLPRPRQKDLAARSQMSPSDVTRCLQDTSAKELQMLWKMANNLDEVLSFARRPMSR